MSDVIQIFNPMRHARKQIEALGYKDGDLVCFTGFYPVNDPRKDKDRGCKAVAKLPNLPGDLDQWAKDGRGVYLVVNSGGHGIEDIKLGRAIFYEYDRADVEQMEYFKSLYPKAKFEPVPEREGFWYVPLDIQKNVWQHLGLPEPTFQVDTGGKSIHSYWVFCEPTEDVQSWRQLQTDLLSHAKADKSLKNQNRVMRLAGFPHAATGNYARICGGHGNKYSFDRLRDAIPAQKQTFTESKPGGSTTSWKEFDSTFRYPIRESVPLEVCLSKECRELLAKGTKDLRNENGYKLAVDLLGVSADLIDDGQVFDGDPREMFFEYCRKCPPGEGWVETEWEQIWKSAQAKPRGGSLSADKLKNCVKSWAWRNISRLQSVTKSLNDLPIEPVDLDEPSEDSSEEEQLRIAVANYNKICDSANQFRAILAKRNIAKEFGIRESVVEQLARDLDRGQASELRSVGDSLVETFGDIEMRSKTQDLRGIPSGFYDLDAMTQGFQRGGLTIPAARPSIGKTAWCLDIAKHVAMVQKLPVAIFSLEMDINQINYRLISSEVEIESGRLRSGQIRDNEWEQLGSVISRLSFAPIYVDDTPEISVQEIKLKLRRLRKQEGDIGLVIIDYLQLMPGEGENRNMELAKITRRLKGIARELNTHVMALSQLSREVESRSNKRPMMSDLRDSGGLEQDADLIAMLYREDYYDPNTPDRGTAEVIVVKHRNGPTGTVRLIFDAPYAKFKNLCHSF